MRGDELVERVCQAARVVSAHLGPIYHLRRRADRIGALAEAARVVRPGGPVFRAAA